MDDFQVEVVQRLARVEAKLDNGIGKEIRELGEWSRAWREAHPLKCPLIERKATIYNPILVGVATGGLIALGNILLQAVVK